MFTATVVLCNSDQRFFKLEISRNSYPGILKIHKEKNKSNNGGILLGTFLLVQNKVWMGGVSSVHFFGFFLIILTLHSP